MDRVELADIAESILYIHKENLLIDPFVRIKVEITEGDFVSSCIQDVSPMSWIIQLNPERHSDFFDIQYSILESLFTIILDDLRFANTKEELKELQKRIVARLTTSLCEIFSNDDDGLEEDCEDEE